MRESPRAKLKKGAKEKRDTKKGEQNSETNWRKKIQTSTWRKKNTNSVDQCAYKGKKRRSEIAKMIVDVEWCEGNERLDSRANQVCYSRVLINWAIHGQIDKRDKRYYDLTLSDEIRRNERNVNRWVKVTGDVNRENSSHGFVKATNELCLTIIVSCRIFNSEWTECN